MIHIPRPRFDQIIPERAKRSLWKRIVPFFVVGLFIAMVISYLIGLY